MFIGRAAEVLSGSLDFDETLQSIAWLTVPTFADWCGVDLVVDNDIERVALAHRDPDKLEMGRLLGDEYPPDPHSETGMGAVIRHGHSEIYPAITDEMIDAGARDERHKELIKELGMRSAHGRPDARRATR